MPATSSLERLPAELLTHIIYLLLAQTPLGPPSALGPVRLVSRTLADAGSSPSLLARVFRLKFDCGAVARRLFMPTTRDVGAQLVAACRVLRSVRRGLGPALSSEDPEEDEARTQRRLKEEQDMHAEQTLLGVLLLMLDNDGKNYAQLEHAGVHRYVREYVRRRMWEGAAHNGGWPVEDTASACALWLMWLTIDRNRLLAETIAEREEVVLRILPFVFLTHRYPASNAPPNHFHLPLTDVSAAAYTPLPMSPRTVFYPSDSTSNTTSTSAEATNDDSTSDPTSDSTPTDADIQHYPHYLPSRTHTTPYFRASIPLTPPLASIPAKLLFVARRELRAFGVPLHLPRDRAEAVRRWWVGEVRNMNQAQGIQGGEADEVPPMPAHIVPPLNLGPTQADYRALNRGKAAPLPRGARWDWEAGRARAVNPSPRPRAEPDDEAQTIPHRRRRRRSGTVRDDDDDDDDDDEEPGHGSESRRWDALWWRMRLCGHHTSPVPRFAPGAVFERGSMRGAWRGKIYIPQGNLMMHLIGRNAPYPGLPLPYGHGMGHPNPAFHVHNAPPAAHNPNAHAPNAPAPAHQAPAGDDSLFNTPDIFSEATMGVVVQPVFLDLEEHVLVCGCSQSSGASDTAAVGERASSSSSSSSPSTSVVAEEGEQGADEGAQSRSPDTNAKTCTPIPVPAPSGIADWRGVPFAGVLPADLPVGHPQHGGAGVPPAAAAGAGQGNAPGGNDNAQGGQEAEDSGLMRDRPPRPLDYSMSNAWLPGGIGDLAFEKRVVGGAGKAPLVRRDPLGGFVEVEEDEEESLERRDEIVISTTGRAPDVGRARGCGAFDLFTTEGHGHLDGAVPEECYVYETYDPRKVSAHDVRAEPASWRAPAPGAVGVGVVADPYSESGDEEYDGGHHEILNPQCAGCLRLEAERRKERAREERRAGAALGSFASTSSSKSDSPGSTSLSTSRSTTPTYTPTRSSIGKRDLDLRPPVERDAKRRRVGGATSSNANASPSSSTDEGKRAEGANAADPEGKAAADQAENAQRAAEAQTQLESLMRNFGRVDVDEDLGMDVDLGLEELDMDGFGYSLETQEGRGAGEDSEDMEMEERLDMEEMWELELDDDEEEENEDEYLVLGDDHPYGQPGGWIADSDCDSDAPLATPKKTYIPRTRREFSRARVTSTRSPCSHSGDTIFTGHTPACGLPWGQRYTTYGRLRPWDGLVGLVRVGRAPVNFLFIFGYVVGARGEEEGASGGTFVGEWRVAASDPMRPAWGGPFVMSRVAA